MMNLALKEMHQKWNKCIKILFVFLILRENIYSEYVQWTVSKYSDKNNTLPFIPYSL